MTPGGGDARSRRISFLITRRVIVFLLAGAVVNVAVAWGFTFRRQSLQKAIPIAPNASMLSIDWNMEPYSNDSWVESHRCSNHEIHTRMSVSRTGLAVDQFEASVLRFQGSSPFATTIAERVTSGWPQLALTGGRWWVYACNPTTNSEALAGVTPITALIPRIQQLERVLPIQPTWPGFAINTIFYAGVLWLLFASFGRVRRWRHIKRGLCPACAYPVGESEVCTECKAAIPSPLRGEG